MRVLLDECLDWRLARDIAGHDVKTARQMGWTTIKNGELLALATERFYVFVTVDRNLAFQQNLAAFSITVIVLRARTNRLADLKPLLPHELLNRFGLREERFHGDLVVIADAIEELVGLRMKASRVEREDAELPADLRRHVDEHDILGAAERDRDFRGVLANREGENVTRMATCVVRCHRRQGRAIECHALFLYRRRPPFATASRELPGNGPRFRFFSSFHFLASRVLPTQ